MILLPTTTLNALLHLHRPAYIALFVGVLNTVVAYGAFGMALEVWEVSRVSSVAASAPLFTVAASLIGAHLAFSWVTPEELNAFSLVGAFSVVAGSMISALGSRRKKQTSRAS